jgi:hypothetical protein
VTNTTLLQIIKIYLLFRVYAVLACFRYEFSFTPPVYPSGILLKNLRFSNHEALDSTTVHLLKSGALNLQFRQFLSEITLGYTA